MFFGFFWGFSFSIFNYLKDFSKKMLNYRLGTDNEKYWGLNQFSTAANLKLSQHFL